MEATATVPNNNNAEQQKHRKRNNRRSQRVVVGLQQHQQHLLPTAAVNTGLPGLDVVRALHQTVISLRTALDTSREELRRLKELKQKNQSEDPTDGLLGDTLERLALENHVLRRKLLTKSVKLIKTDASTSPRHINNDYFVNNISIINNTSANNSYSIKNINKSKQTEKMEADEKSTESKCSNDGGTEAQAATTTSTSDSEEHQQSQGQEVITEETKDATTSVDEPDGQKEPEAQQNKLAGQGASNESENESEELDDIELIFTTEETCPEVGLQEDLVPITDNETWQQQPTPSPNEQHKSVLKICQTKSADSEPSGLVCNGSNANTLPATAEKSSSMDEAAGSSQSSSIDREESVDRFDESSSSKLNKMWSQCSVLVETDISKCGVLEEVDLQMRNAARRNTLAAPPTAYRPIIHREALAVGRRKSSAPLRPVVDRSGAGASTGARRESGAQTDISAVPAQWRSESYLAHKVAHTFTTLPSKFALPAGVPGRLRLSDKTREARRVMLSDISFTSMVPELSRSADHLCQDANQQQFPNAQNYGSRSTGLRTPESNRREVWARSGGAGLPSPCDCRLSVDMARYRGSLSSIASSGGDSRRHSWRPNAAASFDGWRTPSVIIGPSGSSHACCGSGTGTGGATLLTTRATWSSMPSSPTHVQPPSAAMIARLQGGPKRSRSRVTFQDCPMLIRGSLPNLRSEQLLGDTSGDSTESLIDEAEEYLRRSIDSMLTLSTDNRYSGIRHATRRRRVRRHSEPDLFRDWNPPQDARPYLPKMPRDLKLDHLVKVISPDGRILQGRVRYVGPVAGRDEIHVGVQLPTISGNTDGTFHGKRYFDCGPERAIFVPFKKVVLAWCTT